MAYGLVVGKSNKVKDCPTIVGSMEFEEYHTLCALAKHHDSFFLRQLTNFFEDQSFSIQELAQAQQHLLSLLPQELSSPESALLQKLIAVVAYALNNQEPLHGVAD